MSSPDDATPLEADFAALRKLRDDDASGALKEFFGDAEDPRPWSGVAVEDGRVTKLNLQNCESLAALPAAIGELKALTRLDLHGCSKLTELPAAIGELGALTTLHRRVLPLPGLAPRPSDSGPRAKGNGQQKRRTLARG